MANTFQYMTDDTESTGLCDYCPLEQGAKGTHLYPTGHYSCEGRCCREAYTSYIESCFDDDPCNHCINKGWETSDRVAACNCCEEYEFFQPVEDEDE